MSADKPTPETWRDAADSEKLRLAAPLQYAVFNRLRSLGAEKAERTILHHAGEQYRLLVDRLCSIEVNLVTIEQLDGPAKGRKLSMAVVNLDLRSRLNIDAVELMVTAFQRNLVVEDPHGPQYRSYILPWQPVPSCYIDSDAGSTA